MRARDGASPEAALHREIRAWCLYDFANSSFTTLVVTFLYAAYFTQAMAPDEARGTQLWSWGISLSFLTVALISPLIGAHADAIGRRKPQLILLSAVAIGATAALAFVLPPHWALALTVFAIANVAFETSGALYNAYLPELAPPSRIGRISGYAWGLGYLGGLLSLAVGFTMTGLPNPAGGWYLAPWLSTESGWNLRATNLLVAGWFLLFALPAFVCLQDRGGPIAGHRPSLRRVASTLRDVLRYRQATRFLIARTLYNDGLVTIFSFGGIYAAGTFGMSFGEVVLLGIWLNVVAGAGAVAFGHLDDRIGGKATIVLTLLVLILAGTLGAAASSVAGFWVAATGIGLMAGPNQAASRSLMGRLTPPGKLSEFFGFFALSGKLTAFLGPLMLGQVTAWTGNQRWGMASVLVFLAAGLLLLAGVREEAGRREAIADPAAVPS